MIVPGTPFSRQWLSSIFQQSNGACRELLSSLASELLPLFSFPSLLSGKYCISFGFWPCEDIETQLVGLGGLIVPEIDPWRQG